MSGYADCPFRDHSWNHKTKDDCIKAFERDELEARQAVIRAREGVEQPPLMQLAAIDWASKTDKELDDAEQAIAFERGRREVLALNKVRARLEETEQNTGRLSSLRAG